MIVVYALISMFVFSWFFLNKNEFTQSLSSCGHVTKNYFRLKYYLGNLSYSEMIWLFQNK
jgi:hypothetical protein